MEAVGWLAVAFGWLSTARLVLKCGELVACSGAGVRLSPVQVTELSWHGGNVVLQLVEARAGGECSQGKQASRRRKRCRW